MWDQVGIGTNGFDFRLPTFDCWGCLGLASRSQSVRSFTKGKRGTTSAVLFCEKDGSNANAHPVLELQPPATHTRPEDPLCCFKENLGTMAFSSCDSFILSAKGDDAEAGAGAASAGEEAINGH